MKVIFLDFDGVINNWDHFELVDYKNVKYLLEIIKETDAKVVVSSSKKYLFQINDKIDYRNTYYYEYIKLLEEYGVNIYDVTPYVEEKRELEILSYLNNNSNIEEYLILDDDDVYESLMEHTVFLDWYNGILEEHVNPSIEILNGNLGLYPSDFDFSESYEKRLIRINKYHNSREKV